MPSPLLSPAPAVMIRVRLPGAPVSTKRFSRAACSASGMQLCTKPVVVTTSSLRMSAIASSALTILFFFTRLSLPTAALVSRSLPCGACWVRLCS